MKTRSKKNFPKHKILFLEDSQDDLELMLFELKQLNMEIEYKRVSSKKDFIEALETFQPDIVLADYSIPMFNGMHAFQIFKKQKMDIPFILVTGSLSEKLALECMDEGVDDVVLKSSFKRLPLAITKNLELKNKERERERIYAELEKKNQELQFLKENAEKTKTHNLLSRREFEILCLIASGKSIKEIADQLGLSPATVATYRTRILEKMNLKSNVDITRYVILNNLKC